MMKRVFVYFVIFSILFQISCASEFSSESSSDSAYESDPSPVHVNEEKRARLSAYLQLRQLRDTDAVRVMRRAREYTQTKLSRHLHAAASNLREFFGAEEKSCRLWIEICSPQIILKLRNYLIRNMFNDIKVSNAIKTIPGVVPEDLLEAIEKLLMKAKLVEQMPYKHVRLLQIVFEMWPLLRNPLNSSQYHYSIPVSFPIENFIALDYFLKFKYDGTKGAEGILKIIKYATMEELAEKEVLDLAWFHNRLSNLKVTVCDVERQVGSGKPIRMHAKDAQFRFYSLYRKQRWDAVLNDPSYSQVVRDISELQEELIE